MISVSTSQHKGPDLYVTWEDIVRHEYVKRGPLPKSELRSQL